MSINKRCTAPINVGKYILQGDTCSPLLSNFCFNMLTRVVQQRKFEQFGYLWRIILFIDAKQNYVVCHSPVPVDCKNVCPKVFE